MTDWLCAVGKALLEGLTVTAMLWVIFAPCESVAVRFTVWLPAAFAAGANFYLVKPVASEMIVQYAKLLCGIAS